SSSEGPQRRMLGAETVLSRSVSPVALFSGRRKILRELREGPPALVLPGRPAAHRAALGCYPAARAIRTSCAAKVSERPLSRQWVLTVELVNGHPNPLSTAAGSGRQTQPARE